MDAMTEGERLTARARLMLAELHEIRNNHPGNQLVLVGAGKFSRWADTVRDLLALVEAQEQEKNEKGDTRMATMGDSIDNLTAPTNDLPPACVCGCPRALHIRWVINGVDGFGHCIARSGLSDPCECEGYQVEEPKDSVPEGKNVSGHALDAAEAKATALEAERDRLLADWREQDEALQRIDAATGVDGIVSCPGDVAGHVDLALADERQQRAELSSAKAAAEAARDAALQAFADRLWHRWQAEKLGTGSDRLAYTRAVDGELRDMQPRQGDAALSRLAPAEEGEE